MRTVINPRDVFRPRILALTIRMTLGIYTHTLVRLADGRVAFI